MLGGGAEAQGDPERRKGKTAGVRQRQSGGWRVTDGGRGHFRRFRRAIPKLKNLNLNLNVNLKKNQKNRPSGSGRDVLEGGLGGGGWHKASVLGCLPLVATAHSDPLWVRTRFATGAGGYPPPSYAVQPFSYIPGLRALSAASLNALRSRMIHCLRRPRAESLRTVLECNAGDCKGSHGAATPGGMPRGAWKS